MIRIGTMIYAEAPISDEAIQNAKNFITEKKLTQEDVKIVKKVDGVVVIAKKELDY